MSVRRYVTKGEGVWLDRVNAATRYVRVEVERSVRHMRNEQDHETVEGGLPGEKAGRWHRTMR
jgi:hypothetical protein